MIGSVIPAIRPISGAYMPAALTTTSAAMSYCSPACCTSTPITRPSRTPMPLTRWCCRTCTPRLRAPAASANARFEGSSQPSVGSQTAPSTPSVVISGNRSCASVAETSSIGSPKARGPAGLALELLEAGPARREPQGSDLVPRGIDAGLGRQPPVQLDAVHHHPRQRHGAPQLPDEPGAVERRARRQLRAVQQHDVGPAPLREVVRDRRPADPAADDRRPGRAPSPRPSSGRSPSTRR